jgi:hypothetical protein
MYAWTKVRTNGEIGHKQISYLGALEVDVVDETHAVAGPGNLVSYAQVLESEGIPLLRRGIAVGAHEEQYSIALQVALEWFAVETLELEATWQLGLRRLCQVLDQDSACKLVLVGLLWRHAAGNTEMLVLVEPQHMEVAATISQLAEERLDGMDSMQQLEAVVEVNVGLTHAVSKHGLAMDGKQLLASKVADDVDLERPERLVPLENVGPVGRSLPVPWWGSGRHLGG